MIIKKSVTLLEENNIKLRPTYGPCDDQINQTTIVYKFSAYSSN
jgi:hypothetical protein